MNKQEGLQLLIDLINLDDKVGDTEPVQSTSIGNEIDWPLFSQLAADHHLRVWIAHRIHLLPSKLVPLSIVNAYQKLLENTRFIQLKHIREFFTLISILEKKGIQSIPFKGFHLAHKYYRDITLRESSDLDLLISYANLIDIISVLKTYGYIPETDLEKLNYSWSQIYKRFPEYNMDFWENGQRVSHIEFHWAMGAPPLRIECSLEEMKPFITGAEFQGQQYSCFTPEGDLLMAAFHHGGKEEWTRLGHILDVGQILNKYPDADYLKAIEWSEDRSISRIVLVGIQLAHQLCKVPIPESIREKANSPEIRALSNNRIEKIYHLADKKSNIPFRLNSTLYHLLSRDTLAARLSLALKYINHFFRRARLKLIRSLSPA